MSVRLRKARKEHRCTRCGGVLPAREHYVDERRASARGRAFRWHRTCWARELAEREREQDHDDAMDAAEAGWDGHKVWR